MNKSIFANLKRYPFLEQLADPDWIEHFDNLEPWLIDNPIARWLVGGGESGTSFASQLNDNLEVCIGLNGGQSRARKLFAQEKLPDFWPTLMEIYIASWLSGFATSVEFRSDIIGGPDLLVEFGDGHKHKIEVKSFQQDAFWGELIDRCNALGRKQSLRPQFRCAQDSSDSRDGANSGIPKPFEQQMIAVARIVNAQIDRFSHHGDELTEWCKDSGTGVEVRWQEGAGGIFPERLTSGADPDSTFRMISNQLTSGGEIREQIKHADAVVTCVSRYTELSEFYVLRDHLRFSDPDEIGRLVNLVPGPVLSLQSLGSLVAVAVGLDQRPAHLTFSVALPRTDPDVRAKQDSLRNALATQGIEVYASTDCE